MPAQQTQSNFLQEMGQELAKAWSAHAGDSTEIAGDFSDVPPFDDGVAKLVKVTLAKYKPDVKSEELRGKWYFMAEAIIMTPKRVKDDLGNVRAVAGKRTKIGPIPICNTPGRATKKTVEHHIADIMNELRKLGAATKGTTHAQLPAIVAGLNARANDTTKRPLYLKCRVWKGAKQTEGPYAGKEPLANHQWNGLDPDFDPKVDLAAGVDDDTAAVAAGGMPGKNGAPQAGGKLPVATAAAAAEPNEGPVNVDGADDASDLDALAAAADAGIGKEQTSPEEKAAEAEIRQIAEQHGIGSDVVDAAENFAAVVAMIREAQEGGAAGGDDAAAAPDDDDAVAEPGADDAAAEPEPEPEPVEFVPKVGATGKVKVKAKDGKVKTVPVNCTKVVKKDKRVELVNLDDQRMKWTGDKAMAWDKVKWD